MYHDYEHLIRHLLTYVECAACGQGFQLADIQVLGHENQFWLIMTECAHCANQAIILALLEIEQVSSPAPELSPAEQAQFRHQPPISPDDLREIHTHLQSANDLASLLSD
ncbi:MAG: hypothetical protein KKA73_27425 [Chloroflexi bacterium]|nr:hypothetical protein [Chloroflexota bacterium]MBU1751428.1 hypothetical protein [Chloroflexota bacterium]